MFNINNISAPVTPRWTGAYVNNRKPKNAASLIPTLEFPTKHLESFKRYKNNRGGKFQKNENSSSHSSHEMSGCFCSGPDYRYRHWPEHETIVPVSRIAARVFSICCPVAPLICNGVLHCHDEWGSNQLQHQHLCYLCMSCFEYSHHLCLKLP